MCPGPSFKRWRIHDTRLVFRVSNGSIGSGEGFSSDGLDVSTGSYAYDAGSPLPPPAADDFLPPPPPDMT